MNRLAVVLIAVVPALAGCSWSQKMEAKVAPDTLSLADRCGAIMQAAMPFAQLELGDRTAHSPDVATIIAQVTATRTDLPKDAVGPRDLAAECTFVNDVMTAFRWTKGGPPPPPGSDQLQPGAASPANPPPANPLPSAPPPAGKTPPRH